MIETPTVFILGAGASKEYGFPLGYELYVQACKELEGRGFDYLKEFGFSSNRIRDFRDKLYHSELESIDTFINYNHEFEEIGKATIAMLLIPCENEANLMHKKSSSWYRHLWNNMRTKTLAEFASNKVGFITFNYDRSLEHYLFIVLKNTFTRDAEYDIAEVLKQIPIIHVYGQLGYLPWQGDELRPYESPDPPFLQEHVERSVGMIKLIYESREEFSQYDEVQKLISRADRGYFLGFGYDEINLTNIGIKSRIRMGPGYSKLQGTAIGLKDLEVRKINQIYQFNIARKSGHASIYEFLRNDVQL